MEDKNNKKNTGKSGISYYSDHKRGLSNMLIIENNVVSNSGILDSYRTEVQLLSLSSVAIGLENWVVGNFILQNNSVTSLDEIEVATEQEFEKVKVISVC